MSVWKSFIVAVTALLPLIDPAGTALVFLALVGEESAAVYRQLAGRVALTTFLFLVVVDFSGSLLLSFFNISLPIVQVAGGIIISCRAWRLLFERDAGAEARNKHREIGRNGPGEELRESIFYPFTFPITAGPGALVVILTLSAHASANGLAEKTSAHAGIALAAAFLSGFVYLCYGYAPKLVGIVSPFTIHGVLRVIAFLLMCIGVQLGWNGISALWAHLLMR